MFVFQRSIIPPAQVVIVSALLIDKNDLPDQPFPAAHLAFLNLFLFDEYGRERKVNGEEVERDALTAKPQL